MYDRTKRLASMALFSALAVILMYFPKFPLLAAAPFLTFDFSDVPLLMGGFALGPLAGLLMTSIKNLIFFVTVGESGPIGAFMNWSSTAVFITVSSYIYHRIGKTKRNALIGLALGMLSFITTAVILNTFVALPLWGIPKESIPTLVKTAVIPFNILRGLISSAVTLFLYKRVTGLIKRILKI